MILEQLLVQKRTQIVGKWFDLILDTYPEDTARFLKREKDRFINPVGYATYQSICEIYDALCQGINLEKMINPTASIIKIRSVQDFSPSQNVIFCFLLKKAIREVGGSDLGNYNEELFRFESRIDDLALQAFNIYMENREILNEVRMNEIKTQKEEALRLLQRMNII